MNGDRQLFQIVQMISCRHVGFKFARIMFIRIVLIKFLQSIQVPLLQLIDIVRLIFNRAIDQKRTSIID